MFPSSDIMTAMSSCPRVAVLWLMGLTVKERDFKKPSLKKVWFKKGRL
jgi:hypothetical protein